MNRQRLIIRFLHRITDPHNTWIHKGIRYEIIKKTTRRRRNVMSKNTLLWLSAYVVLAGIAFIIWYYFIIIELVRCS